MSGFGSSGSKPDTPHSFPNIMSDNEVRYRRNTLMVSLIIISISIIPDIDYSSLSLFGVKLGKSGAENETVIWLILMMLFFYQSSAFIIYSLVAYRNWYVSVLRPEISWWGYAFRRLPNLNHPIIKEIFENHQGKYLVKRTDTQGTFSVLVVKDNNTNISARAITYDTRYAFKWKLIMFSLLEFGLPTVFVLWAGRYVFGKTLDLLSPTLISLIAKLTT